MKSKLITSLLLAAAFAFAPATNAADDDKKEKKKPAAAKKAKKSKKERGLPGALGKLELSADQKKEVLALMKETGAKRKEAGKDKAKVREIQKAHQAKLAEILGKEKVAELKKLNAEARKARGGKKGGAKPEAKKKKKKD